MIQNTWIDRYRRVWHPSGMRVLIPLAPVVALRLPPANLSNRSAVNRTIAYDQQTASR